MALERRTMTSIPEISAYGSLTEGGKGFMRDAWKLLKKKRDSWIPERMWRVIYFMRHAWFVNYLCLVVKISFPWGFSDNDWFKTWRVNFVKICAWNGITIPPLPPSLHCELNYRYQSVSPWPHVGLRSGRQAGRQAGRQTGRQGNVIP